MNGKQRFLDAVYGKNEGCPPVWFMRQAGRYHSHYQNLKMKHSFMELCKDPRLAFEVTMGPLEAFDFDAAILFSDLLFPLEALGMGLDYAPGPQLSWHLREPSDLKRLDLPQGGRVAERASDAFGFQAEALKLLDREVGASRGLIGFVGGILTLYCYAVEGSHAGGLELSRKGLRSGLYQGFVEASLELVVQNMVLQARAGAQTVAIFDTCAGEFQTEEEQSLIASVVSKQVLRFKELCPSTPVIYYSKGTSSPYWARLGKLPFEVLGVDWRTPLPEVFSKVSRRGHGLTGYSVQGNYDPEYLRDLESAAFEKSFSMFLEQVKQKCPEDLGRWVVGLGHGVLQKTPETNVKRAVELVREVFGDRGV